jgi:hypothetical protein
MVSAVLLGTLSSARADESLDQFFEADWSNNTLWAHIGHNLIEENVAAQTFTAGAVGALTRVEMLVALAYQPIPRPLILEVQSTTAGEPDGTVLASASLPSSSLSVQPEFVSFVLDTPVPVQIGDVLALVLRCDEFDHATSQWYFLIGKLGDLATYPGGRGFSWYDGTLWDAGYEYDFGFRTYLDSEVAVVSATWGGVKALYRDTAGVPRLR